MDNSVSNLQTRLTYTKLDFNLKFEAAGTEFTILTLGLGLYR